MSNLNARLKQKHDTEANWNKATNFVPMAGELIVYDADGTHDASRIKIGDGSTTVGDLPFFGEGNTIFKILNGFPSGKRYPGDIVTFSCTLQDNMTSPSIDTMKKGDLCLYQNDTTAFLLICTDPWTINQFDWAAVVLASTDDGAISGSRISNGSITEAKLSSEVQASLDKADKALPISGGTLTGNLSGEYITGTWLQGTANNHLSSSSSKICVQDGKGRICHRTPTEIRSDIGAAGLSSPQNWSAEQHFNAGFSALNNNFRFSDTTNIGMELGRQDGTPGTPYIDFHTDGKSSTDYNSRLLATDNSLQITASGGVSLNGQRVVTDVIEEIPFSLNTEYFSFVMDGSSRRTNMFKLFGTDMVFVIVSLLTTKTIGKTSVFMLNKFESRYAGYRVQTGIVCRSAQEPVGRIRINGGGTAIWLDTFDNISIATGATLEATFLYRCTS